MLRTASVLGCVGAAAFLISEIGYGDVFLRSGEAIFLGGQRVVCDGGGGFPPPPLPPPPAPVELIQSKSFRCEPVNPLLPELRNTLKVTLRYGNGRVATSGIAHINYGSDCSNHAEELDRQCSGSASCSYEYCDLDNPINDLLDSTLYNIRIDRSGAATVDRVDHFRFASDCREALSR